MPDINVSPITFPRRIAVINRGEAAVRLIRAVRELNAEYGQGITTIAFHTDSERRAMCPPGRRSRDAPQDLGRHRVPRPRRARTRPAGVQGQRGVGGLGFRGRRHCVRRVVRTAEAHVHRAAAGRVRTLGDKVEAKLLAEKVGVPLAPWSGGPVDTREDARRHAEAIGYPLIIKARSGGGGRGIRKVFAPDELEVGLERTQGEAERSFGDPVVFLERLVTDARHVILRVGV